jgi:hypothetical protein
MIWLLSGEILGGEPDPNQLGFAESGVSYGGSVLSYGVVSRSLIVRSAISLVRGSTTGDPLSYSSVSGILTSSTTVNGVMPSSGPANRPRSTCDLGCRVHRTVAAAARAMMARVILVVMAPWAGTVGAVSSPLVRSSGGVGNTDVQELSVEEPS